MTATLAHPDAKKLADAIRYFEPEKARRLTAEERTFEHCYEIEWRIEDAPQRFYREAIAKRQGACLSGFDPTPPSMPSCPERAEARARRRVRHRINLASAYPFQDNLDDIAPVLWLNGAPYGIARALMKAIEMPAESIFALVRSLDALAADKPALRRDIADAKQCLDAIVMLLGEAA